MLKRMLDFIIISRIPVEIDTYLTGWTVLKTTCLPQHGSKWRWRHGTKFVTIRFKEILEAIGMDFEKHRVSSWDERRFAFFVWLPASDFVKQSHFYKEISPFHHEIRTNDYKFYFQKQPKPTMPVSCHTVEIKMAKERRTFVCWGWDPCLDLYTLA